MTSEQRIDLNADLGEGFGAWTLGDDDALLDLITSANVACGFHAGDPTVLRRTCERAAERGVVIGAQVGYRDLAGFGRRFIDVEPHDLTNDVLYQLGALEAFARVAGTQVRYVKPHGALYNAIVHHEEQAMAVAEAVRRYDPTLPVLGLPGSVWLAAAEGAGLTPVAEAFADRAYTAEGTLVSRREADSVLHDPDHVAERTVRMATRHEVVAADGSVVSVRAGSVCVHGDSEGAVAMAAAVRRGLEEAGVRLAPFVGGDAA
ncbi:LamB/YcsF family protein [Nocardioides sp. Soil805]|uniref:LamB/YcsF family protein n=1 Tax=Nocardioides sp. Soil805 TaxID=1736416 RepID=UPI000B1A6F20|nr:5-oxoprolinase subunit PxpA [Nocardioides sp. Soil805]